MCICLTRYKSACANTSEIVYITCLPVRPNNFAQKCARPHFSHSLTLAYNLLYRLLRRWRWRQQRQQEAKAAGAIINSGAITCDVVARRSSMVRCMVIHELLAHALGPRGQHKHVLKLCVCVCFVCVFLVGGRCEKNGVNLRGSGRVGLCFGVEAKCANYKCEKRSHRQNHHSHPNRSSPPLPQNTNNRWMCPALARVCNLRSVV